MSSLKSELKELFSIVLNAYEIEKNSKDERVRDNAFAKYLDNCFEITQVQILNKKNNNETRAQRLS